MRKYIITAAALLAACLSTSAQTFQEGFFLKGYTLGYRYNPALSNEGSVIGLVQWNNFSHNNFGASSFLYPSQDGTLVTALHESVPASTFLGSLQEDNCINGAVNLNLASYGWRKEAAYHTLEANLRGNYNVSVPKEIFQILKEGSGESAYDLSGFRLGAQAYFELAYGYSRQLTSWLSAGARAKLLVGLESVGFQFSRFDLAMSEEEYLAQVEADLRLTSTGGKYLTDEEGYIDPWAISYKDKWMLPAGGGLAFDLGLVASPVEGLTISLSALDLGAILWYYGNAGHSKGEISFKGVTDLSLDQIKNGEIAQEFSELKDQAMDAIRMKPAGKKTSLEPVSFTLNLAARYEMPFYRPLSVGVSGSYRGGSPLCYKEIRGSLAWNPSKQFGITGNIGTGDFGLVYGAALTLGLYKFHLNVGLQNGFGGTIPYTSIPLKANSSYLTVGLSYDI